MERWRLDTDKFVTITNIRMVPTEYGQAMILSLLNIGEVWVPEHLKTKIMNSDTYFNPPFYLRPLGMKPCKDKSRKENPQKPTQLTSRSHPRHLVGKRTAQKTPS